MRILALIGWLLFVACAPAAGTAPPPTPTTVVQVQNHNWSDVVVYLVRGTSRIRLGTVTALTSAELRIPPAAAAQGGSLRLYADPIGSPRGFLSDPVTLWRGQRLHLELGANLQISFLSVSG